VSSARCRSYRPCVGAPTGALLGAHRGESHRRRCESAQNSWASVSSFRPLPPEPPFFEAAGAARVHSTSVDHACGDLIAGLGRPAGPDPAAQPGQDARVAKGVLCFAGAGGCRPDHRGRRARAARRPGRRAARSNSGLAAKAWPHRAFRAPGGTTRPFALSPPDQASRVRGWRPVGGEGSTVRSTAEAVAPWPSGPAGSGRRTRRRSG
jgi:hypothetical protein